MQYLDHKKMPCTFVLQGGKSLKGIIDGRDTYTIFVQTEEKTHCLFKGSVMDIIPAEKLDLKEIKDITLYGSGAKKRNDLKMLFQTWQYWCYY
ncbi:RNA chaperone Hfq [Bacillus cereus]|nr:RNA chaperone Hfq [Bacillus cereus]